MPLRSTLIFFLTLAFGQTKDLKDIEFARPQGIALTLDALLPDSPTPRGAVILVHGGGWEAGDKRTYIRPWFDTLTQARIPWFTINYRLGPRSTHPAAVEDIEAAFRWVQRNAKSLNIDPKRLVLMGESAGGHLVALAALRGKIHPAGLISFYGIHDIPQWVQERGELPKNIAAYLADHSPQGLLNASPVSYIKPNQPPMLLVHGTADNGVPFAQSQRLCKASQAKGAACDILLIEGAPHGVENWESNPAFHTWKPKLLTWLSPLIP